MELVIVESVARFHSSFSSGVSPRCWFGQLRISLGRRRNVYESVWSALERPGASAGSLLTRHYAPSHMKCQGVFTVCLHLCHSFPFHDFTFLLFSSFSLLLSFHFPNDLIPSSIVLFSFPPYPLFPSISTFSFSLPPFSPLPPSLNFSLFFVSSSLRVTQLQHGQFSIKPSGSHTQQIYHL